MSDDGKPLCDHEPIGGTFDNLLVTTEIKPNGDHLREMIERIKNDPECLWRTRPIRVPRPPPGWKP